LDTILTEVIMGVLAIHSEHRTIGGLVGLGRHCGRGGSAEVVTEGGVVLVEVPDPVRHSNADIDPARSKLNYAIKAMTEKTLEKQFYSAFERLGLKGNTQLRTTGDKKNQSKIDDFVVTLPEGCNEKEYFADVARFFVKFYGSEEAILAAYVHKDEARPHLHIQAIPFVQVSQTKKKKKKGADEGTEPRFKMSRKEFWAEKGGKHSYSLMMDNLHSFLVERGHQVERGVAKDPSAARSPGLHELKKRTADEVAANRAQVAGLQANVAKIEKQSNTVREQIFIEYQQLSQVRAHVSEWQESIEDLKNRASVLQDELTIAKSGVDREVAAYRAERIKAADVDVAALKKLMAANVDVELEGKTAEVARLKTQVKDLEALEVTLVGGINQHISHYQAVLEVTPDEVISQVNKHTDKDKASAFAKIAARLVPVWQEFSSGALERIARETHLKLASLEATMTALGAKVTAERVAERKMVQGLQQQMQRILEQ
jgi:archaellum component FlaC